MRGAHVALGGALHAEEPCCNGENRADQETDGRLPAKPCEEKHAEHHDNEDRQNAVLPTQIRHGAFADVASDFFHPRVGDFDGCVTHVQTERQNQRQYRATDYNYVICQNNSPHVKFYGYAARNIIDLDLYIIHNLQG